MTSPVLLAAVFPEFSSRRINSLADRGSRVNQTRSRSSIREGHAHRIGSPGRQIRRYRPRKIPDLQIHIQPGEDPLKSHLAARVQTKQRPVDRLSQIEERVEL